MVGYFELESTASERAKTERSGKVPERVPQGRLGNVLSGKRVRDSYDMVIKYGAKDH